MLKNGNTAEMFVEAIASGRKISDELLIDVVASQESPERMKSLSGNLLCYGLITSDQRALLSYVFPQMAGA